MFAHMFNIWSSLGITFLLSGLSGKPILYNSSVLFSLLLTKFSCLIILISIWKAYFATQMRLRIFVSHFTNLSWHIFDMAFFRAVLYCRRSKSLGEVISFMWYSSLEHKENNPHWGQLLSFVRKYFISQIWERSDIQLIA